MTAVKIGVVGTGHVGTTLGAAWASKGHHVMLGSREPRQERLREWVALDPEHRHAGSEAEAVAFGQVVVMAVPGRLLPEVLDTSGRENFSGKVVLDPTNPFVRSEGGEWTDLWGDDDSGAEFLQRELPGISVVKAFNEILYAHMNDPHNSPVKTVRIAGDDEAAKRVVAELAAELGWRVEDIGPLKAAEKLEHAAISRYS